MVSGLEEHDMREVAAAFVFVSIFGDWHSSLTSFAARSARTTSSILTDFTLTRSDKLSCNQRRLCHGQSFVTIKPKVQRIPLCADLQGCERDESQCAFRAGAAKSRSV